MTAKKIGQEGFIWFVGVVEDRNDPLKLGRVRVRIYNVHSLNTSVLPTDSLPWATILMPPFSASNNQVGLSPTGLTVGSTVVGFFMDGLDNNFPVVFGTFHGIPDINNNLHDVPEQAREVNNLTKDFDAREPASAYNSKYPFNKVFKTERGHIIEIDDTPDNERIHVYHKSGTYTEINKEGRKVDKVVDKHFEIIFKDQTIHIRGKQDILIDGNQTVNIKGQQDVVIDGNQTVNAKGNQTVTVDGRQTVNVKSNANITVDGSFTLESKGNMRFKAPRIDLN